MLLEAEIDQKLLDLEDVKQSINEVLHQKQFLSDGNPELKKQIEDAEQRKLKQEKEEKEYLQQKDDTLEEMMDLEDKEQELIDEEEQDIENMKKIECAYKE